MLTGTRPCRSCNKGTGGNPVLVVWDPDQAALSATGAALITDTKKGQQTPTENWTPLGSMASNQRPTLDWSQDILEPWKQVWRLAAGDAPAMPQQTLKFMVKAPGKPASEPAACAKVRPWIKPASELASCSKGRGQVITEKLQEMTNMGPVAVSRYSGDEKSRKKKLPSKKPAFPTLEEKEDSTKNQVQTSPRNWSCPRKMYTLGRWRMLPRGNYTISPFPHHVLTEPKPRTLQDYSFQSMNMCRAHNPNNLFPCRRTGLINSRQGLIGPW